MCVSVDHRRENKTVFIFADSHLALSALLPSMNCIRALMLLRFKVSLDGNAHSFLTAKKLLWKKKKLPEFKIRRMKSL